MEHIADTSDDDDLRRDIRDLKESVGLEDRETTAPAPSGP
jgi:hypothetical protein